MSSNDEIVPAEKNKNKVLQMLEEAGVSTESLVEESHPFWDTQVSSVTTVWIILFILILNLLHINSHAHTHIQTILFSCLFYF